MHSLRDPAVRTRAPANALGGSHRQTFVVFKRGGMGSVLASLPFVARLRECQPDARILLITDHANRELAERCDIADAVMGIAASCRPMSAWQHARLVARIRRHAPSVFFDLQMHTHRFASAMLAAASGARHRVGFYRPSDRARQQVFDTLVLANMFAPVHDLYMQMARAIGCPAPGAMPCLSLRVTPDDEQRAGDLLGSWLLTDVPLLVVNTNTSDKAVERRWPLPLFREAVAGILLHRPDAKVVLIGTAAEFDHVEQLRQSLGFAEDRLRNLAGLTPLGSLLALLRRASCVLTNDSGPFHFSVALGTPTVGLFGPVHPDHYGRMGRSDRTVVFYQPMVCSPCVHVVSAPPCGGDNHCMKAIAPADVEAACLRLMIGGDRAARAGWRFSPSPETSTDAGSALGVWHRTVQNATLAC